MGDALRVLGGKVLGLCTVIFEVIEGPGTPAFADDLVLALDDGMGTAVIEDIGVVGVNGFTF